MTEKRECIAKVKFWFGSNQKIFRKGLEVEMNGEFAYIYKKTK